jgi:hypothetical protein
MTISQKAYEKAKKSEEIPDLKGMQGSSANDIVGFGQAVEEAGLNGKIAVVGFPPVHGWKTARYQRCTMASCWDPRLLVRL